MLPRMRICGNARAGKWLARLAPDRCRGVTPRVAQVRVMHGGTSHKLKNDAAMNRPDFRHPAGAMFFPTSIFGGSIGRTPTRP